MKKFYLLLAVVLTFAVSLKAQVTTEPSPLQEDSQNVVVYFHADQGNKGLMNSAATEGIYAHTGVDVVDAGGKSTSWKYAPNWGDNAAKYKLTYVSPNLWKLDIGDIRTYYGVAANETVKRLCFVFRNANCSKEGKGVGNSDIFVDVVDSGFQLAFTRSNTNNVFGTGTGMTFTAATTQAADITITVNGSAVASQDGVKTLSATYEFVNQGEYSVACKARKGNDTLTQEFNVLCAGNAVQASDATLPPLGVTKNADGSYTFCMAAPQKQNCVVVGSWNDFKPTMAGVCQYVDRNINGTGYRYFKTTVPASQIKGAFSYYYCIDGQYNVGDPYARLVLDPYNDKYISSTVYPDMPQYPEGKVPANTFLAYYADNLLNYNWTVPEFRYPAKDNLVIYEMLLRDFTGTEGKADGNGTVSQAIKKIPYLKDLGVNAVELLPVNEFNGNISWGYNPNFYMAPDKAYGTPQDYKRFIDECHKNGIAVILDVVFNQSDGCHPWYQLYPVERNPFYNQNAPHAYSVLNDWNQGYPLVDEQWRDMLQFWLKEYKVDGFRFDLVKGLGDNDSYANSGDAATNAFNQSRVDRMKKLHGYMKEVNPDAYFINENLAGAQEENLMATDGELNWANYNNAGCQFAMGYSSGANLNGMNAILGGRTAGSTVAYLESHDEERLAYKQNQYGAEGVKGNHAVSMRRLGAAAAQMILEPGSHMIWQFSEMGNAQTTKNSNGGNNTDPKTVNWNLLNDPDNKALMETYKTLIHIRLNPECRELFSTANTSFVTELSGWDRGRVISTKAGDKELFCVINPNTNRDVTVAADFSVSSSQDDYWIALQSHGSESARFNVTNKSITVPANSFAVVSTRNVSGVQDSLKDNTDLKISTAPGSLTVHSAEGTTEVYGLTGARMAVIQGEGTVELPRGIYIVRHGNKAKKVIIR